MKHQPGLTGIAPVLRTENVNKRFGGVTAARDLNIAIHVGQVSGLIGSNGAGKTTFVNTVSGYIKPDSGRVLFDGRDITALSPREITRLGVARSFQIPQIFPTLTALENVLVAIDLHSGWTGGWLKPARRPQKIERAMAILSRYRLEAHADRLPLHFPAGIRKLLDIVLAVVHRPKVLFLDEPTSGISTQEKFEVMDLVMAGLGDEPVAVLFIEHDMDIVRRYASRAIAFHEGGVLADGSVDEVLGSEAVQKFVIGKVGVPRP